jgi:hypothetical protein
MEVTAENSAARKEQSRDQREAIVRLWHESGEPPIDARVLRLIEEQVSAEFGGDCVISPAAIARMLADEGAELRHPDLIEFDADWRQSQILAQTEDFAELEEFINAGPMGLAQLEDFITRLEALRQKFSRESETTRLAQVTSLAVQARQLAQAAVRNRDGQQSMRDEQTEAVEWLKVWLQTPNLFSDWLELRQRSEEFRRKFGEKPQ